MEEITRLARPEILAMKAYSSARKEGKQENMSIFLDANENPYPPFPAHNEQHGFNRYPEPQPHELLELFGEYYQVKREQLLLSRGADEAIDLLIRAFCSAGKDGILITPPTFGMYEIAAQIQNAIVHRVPLQKEDNFQLDVKKILAECQQHPSIKLLFICTPNNPTSGLMKRQDVLTLCTQQFGKSLIIADQTYVEFSGEPSLLHDVASHPNLVVLRTVSKEYSLAGERCGITIAHPDVIGIIGRLLAPYPLSVSAVRAVAKAISPEGRKYSQANMRLIVEQREKVRKALQKFPTVNHIYHSDANFLLVETREPKLLVKMMEEAGIKIRDRSSTPGLEGCVRISIGTPEQNEAMLKVFQHFGTTS